MQRLRGDAEPDRRRRGMDRHHGESLSPRRRQAFARLQLFDAFGHCGLQARNQPGDDRVGHRSGADPPAKDIEAWCCQPAIADRHLHIGAPVADDADADLRLDDCGGADRCLADEPRHFGGVDHSRHRDRQPQRVARTAGDGYRTARDGAGELASDAAGDAAGEPGAGASRLLNVGRGEGPRDAVIKQPLEIDNAGGDRHGDHRRLHRNDGADRQPRRFGFDPRRLLPMASNSARPAVAMTIKMVRNDKRSAPSGADRAVTVMLW